MAKTKGAVRKGAASGTMVPHLKRFRPVSWCGNVAASVSDYIGHLLTELGRLKMEIHDIEQYSRPPNTEAVLSDLMDWVGQHPGEAYAKLVDWQTLDVSRLQTRLKNDRSAKPRIELSAHITKMNNLSVRWHPQGWRDSVFDFGRSDRSHFNLITHRKWAEQPDFLWFNGDEEPWFERRASNELMYVRGVGNLRPEPRAAYGPYAKFNDDVVDAILICAVRAAYERLIEQLLLSFDVEVLDAFDFILRDEVHDDDEQAPSFPVHRVVGWSLNDAAELKKRRAQYAAAEQERCGRAELADLPNRYGFTLEALVDALLQASSKKATVSAPSNGGLNRDAAKTLRNEGFKVTAADVRRIHELFERYTPEALPLKLRLNTPKHGDLATDRA